MSNLFITGIIPLHARKPFHVSEDVFGTGIQNEFFSSLGWLHIFFVSSRGNPRLAERSFLISILELVGSLFFGLVVQRKDVMKR